MGCEFGKPRVVMATVEEPEGEVTGFSETQIDTIRSTWPLLCNEAVRVGVEVFTRIFREAPTIQGLFSHFKIYSVDDLAHSQMFGEHAARFMSVIETLVDQLECPQNIDHQLYILGAKHATFDGYHPEYFRFYTKCMMDVWETELGEEFIQEVRESWRMVFDYLVDRMTEGFDMCLSGQIQDILDSSAGAYHHLYPASLTNSRDSMNVIEGDGASEERGGGGGEGVEGGGLGGLDYNSSISSHGKYLLQVPHLYANNHTGVHDNGINHNSENRNGDSTAHNNHDFNTNFNHQDNHNDKLHQSSYHHHPPGESKRRPSLDYRRSSLDYRRSSLDYNHHSDIDEDAFSGTGGFGDIHRDGSLHLTVDVDYGLARVQ